MLKGPITTQQNICRWHTPQVRRLHLHNRFVTKLLNDLFGVQSRGGCACAVRPALLGVSEDLAL
jgi:hypothetical protein